MIIKTDAVVLQTRRFRESSKIVTLYTREYGKLSAIARGVMQAKSRTGSTLQPMSFISAVIYRKEGRDLQNLSTVETIERFGRLNGSLERMSAGLMIVELVSAAMHDEARNDALFESLVDSLRALDDPELDELNVSLWFMTRLSSFLGYAVTTDGCGVCQEPVTPTADGVSYSLAIGAPLCGEHREAAGYRALTSEAWDLLRELCAEDVETAGRFRSDERAKSALKDTLVTFIRFHMEGMRKLNVNNVTKTLLDGGAARRAER